LHEAARRLSGAGVDAQADATLAFGAPKSADPSSPHDPGRARK
jgi:hypothetical protein